MKKNSVKRYYYVNWADQVIWSPQSTPSNEYKPAFSTTLSWEVIDQDVVNNTSTIKWELRASPYNNFLYVDDILYEEADDVYYMRFGTDSNEYNMSSGDPVKDIIVYAREVDPVDHTSVGSKKTVYTSTSIDVKVSRTDSEKLVASGTFTWPHLDDGNSCIYLQCEFCVRNFYRADDTALIGTDWGYTFDSYNYDYATPDTISRHAMVYSMPAEFTDEESPAIQYAVPSGVTGEIYMTLDGNVKTQSTHIMTVTGASTKAYTFTQADLDKIWKIQDDGLRHKGVKFVIRSVSPVDGETYWESVSGILYLDNYHPELHIQVVDSNEDVKTRLTGNEEVLVRYLSDAKCTTGAKAVKGSTINTESVKNAGITLYGPVSTFKGVQGNVFDFAVVDNHENATTDSKTFPVETGKFIEYVKPTANVSVTEVTGDGKVAITVYGKYYKGGFGKVDNKLKITWSLQEHNQPYDSGVFEDVYVDTDEEDNYSYTFQRTGLNYLDVYELSVGVSDVAVPTEVYAEAIIAAVPVFDWGRQDFAFYVPVTINGAQVPSIVEQGTNYTGWTYRKWSDGTAECWYSKTVSAKINTATGSGYGSGAVSGSNVSFPFTFIAIPTILVSLTPTGTTTPAYLTPYSTAATTEQTGTYQLNSMSSDSTTRNYIINYEVRGKWK